ncbi:MAG: hypothetical protein ACPL7K_09670 [Armatimonadota bacterium]
MAKRKWQKHYSPESRQSTKYPLRRIVREFIERGPVYPGSPMMVDRYLEELECGHIVRTKSDWFGRTNAVRRRCKKCWLEQQESTPPPS